VHGATLSDAQAGSERDLAPDLAVGTSVGARNEGAAALDPTGAVTRLRRIWQNVTLQSVHVRCPVDSRRRRRRQRGEEGSRGQSCGNPGERLECAGRRGVFLSGSLDHGEGIAEQGREVVRGVARNGKARAVIGSVGSERREDVRPSWGERRAQGCEIPLLVGWLDQEVEDGTVMPEREAPLRPPCEDVLVHPRHRRPVTDPSTRRGERDVRDVEDREVGEAPRHQAIDER
jgi:hypothetical protein